MDFQGHNLCKTLETVPNHSRALFDNVNAAAEIFENTKQTLPKVTSLFENMIEAERNALILIEAMKKETNNYNNMTTDLSKILVETGISNLSLVSLETIRDISCCAVALNLKDTSDSSILLGIGDQKRRLFKMQQKTTELRFLKERLNEEILLTRENTIGLKKAQPVADNISKEQSAMISKLNEQIKFAHIKLSDYKIQMEKLKKNLERNSMEDDLNHDNLVAYSKNLEKQIVNKENIKKQLSFYENIPADIEQAKEIIKSSTLELEALMKDVGNAIKGGLTEI